MRGGRKYRLPLLVFHTSDQLIGNTRAIKPHDAIFLITKTQKVNASIPSLAESLL